MLHCTYCCFEMNWTINSAPPRFPNVHIQLLCEGERGDFNMRMTDSAPIPKPPARPVAMRHSTIPALIGTRLHLAALLLLCACIFVKNCEMKQANKHACLLDPADPNAHFTTFFCNLIYSQQRIFSFWQHAARQKKIEFSLRFAHC